MIAKEKMSCLFDVLSLKVGSQDAVNKYILLPFILNFSDNELLRGPSVLTMLSRSAFLV